MSSRSEDESQCSHVPKPPNCWLIFRAEMLQRGLLPELIPEAWRILPETHKKAYRKRAADGRESHKLLRRKNDISSKVLPERQETEDERNKRLLKNERRRAARLRARQNNARKMADGLVADAGDPGQNTEASQAHPAGYTHSQDFVPWSRDSEYELAILKDCTGSPAAMDPHPNFAIRTDFLSSQGLLSYHRFIQPWTQVPYGSYDEYPFSEESRVSTEELSYEEKILRESDYLSTYLRGRPSTDPSLSQTKTEESWMSDTASSTSIDPSDWELFFNLPDS
ncbi:hypothetical protein CPC08DRAFT_722233 [Agrocybe pediades]|nr:hypothetical protein CPC08DRAFT_722233 [Agrocybe pediades]